MAVSVTDLAARLPDLPRLVETRAILLSGSCEVLGDAEGGHYVVRSLATGLAAVVGRPAPGPLRETAARGGDIEILCGDDAVEATVAALPGWRAEPATIHVLGASPPATPPRRPDVRLVGPKEPLALAHVPEALRHELEAGRGRSPFAVAFVGGRAAAIAYAPWQTESLADLSIDTLEAHRRQGLGAAAAALLIEHLRAAGKRPVWGALDGNEPSLQLAARLGFVPVDRLFVLGQQDTSPREVES